MALRLKPADSICAVARSVAVRGRVIEFMRESKPERFVFVKPKRFIFLQ